jgi:hypothetical protein
MKYYFSINKLPAPKNDNFKDDPKSDRMVLRMQKEKRP